MCPLSMRAQRSPRSGSNTAHVSRRRPISGTARRGVQLWPSAGGGRLPAIIGRCRSVRLVAVSSGRDPQVRRDSGRGGAAGQGAPGSPSDGCRAALGPRAGCGLVHLPGCRRPPPTAAGLSPAGRCDLPSTPACAPSFRPARASAARHGKFASLSSHLVSASVPVEFHLHPSAYSNSPELRHLENCPREGPFPPYLQRQRLISHHYQKRSPISFTFRFPSLLGMLSYYQASVMISLDSLE